MKLLAIFEDQHVHHTPVCLYVHVLPELHCLTHRANLQFVCSQAFLSRGVILFVHHDVCYSLHVCSYGLCFWSGWKASQNYIRSMQSAQASNAEADMASSPGAHTNQGVNLDAGDQPITRCAGLSFQHATICLSYMHMRD